MKKLSLIFSAIFLLSSFSLFSVQLKEQTYRGGKIFSDRNIIQILSEEIENLENPHCIREMTESNEKHFPLISIGWDLQEVIVEKRESKEHGKYFSVTLKYYDDNVGEHHYYAYGGICKIKKDSSNH